MHEWASHRSRALGLRVSARRFTRRRKASSGFVQRSLTGMLTRSPSTPGWSSRHLRTGVHVASGSVDKEVDRACPEVTTKTSEADTSRSRQHEDREGPRVVRILGAEKAPARGAPERDRPKLSGLTAPSILLPPGRAKARDRSEDAHDEGDDGAGGDGRLTHGPTGRHRKGGPQRSAKTLPHGKRDRKSVA